MKTKANFFENLSAKLIACLFILICLAVGVVGLILPIIPGLLFLAIAAIIVARYFPLMECWLRKSPTMGRYLDTTDGFLDLTFLGKVRFGSLLCVKILIDGIVFTISLTRKLVNLAADNYPHYR